MAYFVMGFYAAAKILLLISGGAAAIAAAVLAWGLLLSAAAWMFDHGTEAMARHWKKRGKRPKGRLSRIIMAHQDNG